MSAIKMIALGRKLSNTYCTMVQPILRKYEMNQTCFDILLFLANNPGNNTARDLCEIRGIKSGMASVAVESLIKSGYLTRENDKTDRRIHRLVPTEKAQNAIFDGQEMQKIFTEKLRHGISDEEIEMFNNFIEKIEKNITEKQ